MIDVTPIGEAAKTTQLDPVSSFLWGYSDYILFGFGLLMLIVAIRKYVVPEIKARYCSDGGEVTDGREEN